MANSAVPDAAPPPLYAPSFHDLHLDGDIRFSIDDLDFPDDDPKVNPPLSSSSSSHKKEITNDDEMKRKTRLLRNRESAQLSRKRKKLYVEELEEKVRSMHSTISDLNSRIGHCMAENVRLRHQLGPAAVRSPFPWIPIAPISPLVPIPKLKKPRKADEKIVVKKVAGVSLVGFLFLTLLLAGLDLGFWGSGSGQLTATNRDRGRVLSVEERGSENATSEPLVALLHIPRNEKMVKIDGNLVISSVLASERAFSGSKEKDLDAGDVKGFSPALAFGLGSTAADGRLQDWFLEGLEGPIFSSGMCTEVFQFDASKDSVNVGGLVPATSITNATANLTESNPYPRRLKNRRTLGTGNMSLNRSTLNGTKRGSSFRSQADEGAHNTTMGKSMVVSVMIDPKEVGDDSMMPSRSISRIFVVVHVDGVKYVTYSCTLPFKSNMQNLVTT